jgi:hypothetical protein
MRRGLLFAFDFNSAHDKFGGQAQFFLSLWVTQGVGVPPTFVGLISQIDGTLGPTASASCNLPRDGRRGMCGACLSRRSDVRRKRRPQLFRLKQYPQPVRGCPEWFASSPRRLHRSGLLARILAHENFACSRCGLGRGVRVNWKLRHHVTRISVLHRVPSRPGEFHPEPLTDPDLILSHHPARAID